MADNQDPAEALATLLAQVGVAPDGLDGNASDAQQRYANNEQFSDGAATAELLRLASDLMGAAGMDDETPDYAASGEEQDEYSDQDDSQSDAYTNSTYDDQQHRRPQPYELWKATHEIEDSQKPTPVLTQHEWDSLVNRLNESSRRKQAYLLRAQHRQIADELAGLTFTPQISKKSRMLAAHNKSLPERVSALMRRKKAKLDKVRHERAQKELEEATFQPQINQASSSKAAALATRMRRRVGHLIQYDIDKRIRAAQRKQMLEEQQDRQLTFSPRLNKNSLRIVEKLNRDRQAKAREAAEALAVGDEATAAAAAAMGKTTKRSLEREQAAVAAAALAAVERDVQTGRLRRIPLGRSGLTMLPGHEKETFQPRVNLRSQILAARAGAASKPVYDRLYEDAQESQEWRRSTLNGTTRSLGRTDGINNQRSRNRSTSQTDSASISSTLPDKSSPDYINVVAYRPRYEFLIRRAATQRFWDQKDKIQQDGESSPENVRPPQVPAPSPMAQSARADLPLPPSIPTN